MWKVMMLIQPYPARPVSIVWSCLSTWRWQRLPFCSMSNELVHYSRRTTRAHFWLCWCVTIVDPDRGAVKRLVKYIQRAKGCEIYRFCKSTVKEESVKRKVYSDTSFACHTGLTSQLRYVVVLADVMQLFITCSVKLNCLSRSYLGAEIFSAVLALTTQALHASYWIISSVTH